MKVVLSFLVGFLLVVATGLQSSPTRADDPRTEMRSLDEQVQEIKSDVLGIAAELSLLEERLLYPSNTQVSIFVSLPEGETLELDSVQLSIDGEPVARHVYTWKELEALRRGGVQRLYTGNVATGEHQLDVVVSGKLAGGRDFSGGRSLRFQKAVEPKLIDLSLTGSAGDSAVQLGSR